MTLSPHAQPIVRRRLVARGIVQGVGFRPHVARLAGDLQLSGEVHNDATSVCIEVEGAADAVAAFQARLLREAPPLARIDQITSDVQVPCGTDQFVIVESTSSDGERTLVPPDTAVCDDCLIELTDPRDRRYRHPFITCTNCGPRLTIIKDLPYDRPATTMAPFPMCADCAAEYADSRDRRYHAQPIGCHGCGPTLSFRATGAEPVERDDALKAAVTLLARGGILAVKGLGGFHLACDATDEHAVTRLRERKARPDKPFALMVADSRTAQRLVAASPDALELLTSPARPIVLLPTADEAPVAPSVAPNLAELGVMLAYAPVHHLLLADLTQVTGRPAVLVMTSGNSSGDPLCVDNQDALHRLGDIADGFLLHDREIAVPVEDTVIGWSSEGNTGVPIRRSRGYAPLPFDVGGPEQVTVLAAGAELKNTVALSSGGRTFVSGHVGDLESHAARLVHDQVTEQLLGFHRTTPTVLVADQHPSYASRAWAHKFAAVLGVPVREVQHHHAHLASLAAEHGRLDQPLLGWVLDGTGYGCDSTIWGGELLLLSDSSTTAQRLGHLGTIRLPGGDAGVRNPVRTAAVALLDADVPLDGTRVADQLTAAEAGFLTAAAQSGAGLSVTSSTGRLFDVVAAILGIRGRISYEAQAAVELEAAATSWARTHCTNDAPELPLPVSEQTLDPAPLVRALVASTDEPAALAYAFHAALARATTTLAVHVAEANRLATVGLSGGVFVNRLLLALTAQQLRDHGLEVLTHQRVPANDGGLALGQVAVGTRLSRTDHDEQP